MRGITLGVFSAQPIYDVDFHTNVLDVAQTMGYAIPPLEKRLLLNRLMVDMKNIGFFQIQDTLSNFALGITGFEQFRMIDWKKIGNIYTPYGGLIYNPEGIEGNGTDAYVSTKFNPAIMGVNYTLDDAGRGTSIYSITNPDVRTATVDGCEDHISVNNMLALDLAAQRINQGTSPQNVSINLTGLGYKSINRISSTNVTFSNREMSVESISDSTELISSIQLILRRGLTNNYYSTLGVQIYHMGASIPYPMSQSFRTIYNQFLSDSGLSPIA